ncbi:hypothetical protein [Bowdeniella massiliensis]|uniref:hypothetical protein n=1 Tax=Bowdeniella massiliensis TaxID=2932264 RepID=UPI002027E672|nr:hypothetical protein [Bowdeniella massiliensis]
MMKLNEAALEVAAQVDWKGSGHQGHFRGEAVDPDYWPCHASRIVTAYLEALNGEGLADLYDYWCERVEALPVPDEVRKGDTFAWQGGFGEWTALVADWGWKHTANLRVLRRAHIEPRQWAVGDLVDETRDLPDRTVVRDEGGDIAEYIAAHDEADMFYITGATGAVNLDILNSPRIIWLPETEDES